MQLKFKFGSIFDAIQQAGIINLADGLDNSRLAYISHLREQAAGRLSTGEFDLTSERARLAHYQANKTSLEEDVLKGDLIPSEQVLELLQGV
ncbi:MAG: hypothetical protein GY744_13710, partial [Gammaproteobacteria bacterium]|nr:hypothetical protein [Gammaproteobacteria bacterium]